MNPSRRTVTRWPAHFAVLLVAASIPLGHVAAAETATYTIGVDGLSCPFCAYGIEKQLGRIDGVGSISTDIESGTVTVTMKDGATMEKPTATRAVEDAGFTLRSFGKASSK